MKFVGGITYGPNTFTFPQTFSGQVTLTNASGYNLYASGAAPNYMAGSLGIGSTSLTGFNIRVVKSITGLTSSYSLATTSTVQSDVTTDAQYFNVSASTVASAFTLANMRGYYYRQSTIGAGSAVTSQYAFFVESDAIGATNNYGFYGSIAAGTGRYNLYMGGTASNYMAGSLGIGVLPSSDVTLHIRKAMTGATVVYGVGSTATAQSDVTSAANYFWTEANTQATAFTVTTLRHFFATQGTIGAGSTVTNQFGFVAASSLTEATNNNGFYGNIAAGTGRYNLYMGGTADNYLAGNLGIGAVPANGTLDVQSILAGGAFKSGISSRGQIQSTVSSRADNFLSALSTAAGTYTTITGYQSQQGTHLGTITNQCGFNTDSTLTGATNNYGFFGNIAAGTGRYNLYMGGTADNYLAGSLTVANSITISGAFALRGSYGAGAITSNFAAGDNALVSNTTGTGNSAVGAHALQFNTTGTNNASMGAYALQFNTTSINSSAVGVCALQFNTTGINNSSMGAFALQFNTTGTGNSAIGVCALQFNTTGTNNSAIGLNALLSNTTGANNSAVGLQALQNNTTGSNNSAVGVNALQDLAITTIAATAIVNGTAYQIVTMGTTTSAQWIASGAVTGTVGETFTANATAGVGTGTVATSANIATQCLNNTALGKASGRGITTGSGNTILGANVTGLAAGLTNNIILANGTGSIRVQSNATTITFADVILPPQAVTASAPAYVKGGMYFDTTLNKMRIGGATAWETVTSV